MRNDIATSQRSSHLSLRQRFFRFIEKPPRRSRDRRALIRRRRKGRTRINEWMPLSLSPRVAAFLLFSASLRALQPDRGGAFIDVRAIYVFIRFSWYNCVPALIMQEIARLLSWAHSPLLPDDKNDSSTQRPSFSHKLRQDHYQLFSHNFSPLVGPSRDERNSISSAQFTLRLVIMVISAPPSSSSPSWLQKRPDNFESDARA